MKIYTEEQVKEAMFLYKAPIRPLVQQVLEQLTPIELPSDEEIFWNTENPKNIDNYIVDKGAEGVSLGWWNGTEWIKMWGSEKINVYGWIKIPIHKEHILNQNK